MNNKIIVFVALFMGFASFGFTQESLTPLGRNPILKNSINLKTNTKGTATPYVKLPFVDDFTNNSIIPNQKLWSNSYTYVNQQFGVNPPSFGVLTFDAVNDSGGVYPYASQFAFIADSLTSNYIRLDSVFGNNPAVLTVADSLYFSFWFQPQGLGNSPESDDSLILHFYNPTTNTWNLVWEHEGMSLDSFITKYGTEFVKVMIPITNSEYLKSNFRIRFMNKASIPNTTIPSWRSGMYDQWHIDYVYLNKGRSLTENSIDDIAFSTSLSTLLNTYISMPWNQYKANALPETKQNASIKFDNLYNGPNTKNINQYFYIQNLFDKTIFTAQPYPDAFNLAPGASTTYYPNYADSITPFIFQSPSIEYADFEVLFRILSNTPPADIIRSNDTMRFYQRFYNYYAYDDGNAEAGYGLSNDGARMAYQFTLNQGDSLQAIQFYFNQTLGNANQQYFFLTVWDSQNGKPGNVIYEQSGVRPEFENDLFKFYTYVLDNPIYLTGTFYVGWRQTTVDNLNVGFDLNNDHHDRIFYNTGGTWTNSSFAGSLMIRPILGNEKAAMVSIPEVASIKQPKLKIYPNPSDQYGAVNIEIDNQDIDHINSFQLKVFDISGRLIKEEEIGFKAQINNLEKGLYLINIRSKDGSIMLNRKLIIR